MSLCMKDTRKVEDKRIQIRNIIELQPKIESAKALIKTALENSKTPRIAFSGGKDSLVILHLIRSIDSTITGVFEDTTNEYPETIEFVKTIENITWLKPKTTFWKCVKEFGLPEDKLKGHRHGAACCQHLKEYPARDHYKEHGVDLVFTGLTSGESRNRMMVFKKMAHIHGYGGGYYFYRTGGYHKCHAIHDWSISEVWTYIDHFQLPYNTIYDILGRHRRCGCRFCTAYLSHMEVIRDYSEADYNLIKKLKAKSTIEQQRAKQPCKNKKGNKQDGIKYHYKILTEPHTASE